MATEDYDPRFADLDLRPTGELVQSLLDDQATAAKAVKAAAGAIATAVELAALRFAMGKGRLIYVGAGTSGRIAVQDGVELGPTFDWDDSRLAFLLAGGTKALISSVEGAEDDSASGEAEMRALRPTADDVVVAVAASGRTHYTVAAARIAAGLGALTIALANNADTPLLEVADCPILLDTGAEVIAGSTRMKAGTAQKIALNLLSTAVMVKLNRSYAGLMTGMRLSNRKLRGRAVAMIARIADVGTDAAVDALAQAGGDIRLATLIARGDSLPRSRAALESAGGDLRRAMAQTVRK